MTQLIKITQHNGNKAVSARELHAFLETDTRFDIWVKRMFEYGFNENADYQRLNKKVQTPNGGVKDALEDYVISMDMAKEIAMIQRTEKGKLARLYFIEMEKKAKEPKITLLSPKENKRKLQMELIELIKQNLHRGDVKQIAMVNGFSLFTCQNVMKGYSFNPPIVKALYDKALQNKHNLGGDIQKMILNLQNQ